MRRGRQPEFRVAAAPAPDVAPPQLPVESGRQKSRSRTLAREIAQPLGSQVFITAIFLAAHVPLAIAENNNSTLATAHAYITLALGLMWAGGSGRSERVAAVVAYIAGAEVLWRMSDAGIYWEFGKYSAAIICVVCLFRTGNVWIPRLPLAYFALLMPSVALTIASEELSVAREQVSFNLSGPFALMICAWFFSTTKFSSSALRNMFVAFLGPALGVATLAARGTLSTDIQFYNASNMVSSGGFGPNQVSAVLGLGALLALFVAFDLHGRQTMRAMILLVMGWLIVQSSLTFSRSGVYMAAAGAGAAALILFRDARLRARILPIALVVFGVANYLVVPYINAFTGGALGERFQDTYLTGRDKMIRADLELWKQNPVMGVGPGQGRVFRALILSQDPGSRITRAPRTLASHTEFSRLVAEHGILGLCALLVLVLACIHNIRAAPDRHARALVGGVVCWSALFMLSDGMRILAPSLVFGIGFGSIAIDGANAGLARIKSGAQRRGPRRLIAGHRLPASAQAQV